MRTLLAIAFVTSAASAASAGTYIGAGIGTGASVSDSTNTAYANDGRSGRLALGFAFGRLAVEGAFTGYSIDMGNMGNTPSAGRYDSRTFQVALKYNYPLANHFEVFARAGLLRTDLSLKDSDGAMSFGGEGYTLSAGLEYRLPAFGSIFMDYTRNHASFDQPAFQFDQTAAMWTLGLNVSL